MSSETPDPGNEHTFVIRLDYPVQSRPRYGYGLPRHGKLYEILDRGRPRYTALLKSLEQYAPSLHSISVEPSPAASGEPHWNNGMFPATDAFCLYALLCRNNPAHYVEIGCGNSTRFARRAIRDHALRTRITAIDPTPRCEIAGVCDELIQTPFEDVDMAVVDQLAAGDILFCDSSHRVFMNSDVAVFFLDVLPRLKPGVLVHLHDILLPDDYPAQWIDRYYSEQYLLACCLLAETTRFETLLPNHFISTDPELQRLVTELWQGANLPAVPLHGESFWMKIG